MPAGRFRQEKHLPKGTLITFVALGINIITTFFGVLPSIGSSGRQAVYWLFLVIWVLVFLLWSIGKYNFLIRKRNIKPCCATNCSDLGLLSGKKGKYCYCVGALCKKSMVIELMYFFMVLFYLAGDNLEQMVCNEGCRNCRVLGQVFTATSLILNIFITLLKTSSGSEEKLELPSAFPIIGAMGDVYDKMLEIAAHALTIDLTVTSILQAIENPTMGDIVYTQSKLFKAVLYTVLLYGSALAFVGIALGFLACSNRAVCCHHKCSKVEAVKRECKKLKWYERLIQWLCGIMVVVFVGLFLVGDIDWIYDFYDNGKELESTATGTAVRLVALILAMILLLVFTAMYICVICLPGLGVAWGEDFFLSQQADNPIKVVQHMMRKQYNDWDAENPAEVSCDRNIKLDGDDMILDGNIKVEDHYGKTKIAVSIKEEITCWIAFMRFMRSCAKVKETFGRRNLPGAATATAQAHVGEAETNGVTVGSAWGLEANVASDHDPSLNVNGNELQPHAQEVESSITDTPGSVSGN